MDLSHLGNRRLQDAVRRNLVSFPAQAPVFPRQPRTDLQWRVALLYFVRGWSFEAIGRRYCLSHERIGQIARDWRAASIAAGYIQEIPGGPWWPSHDATPQTEQRTSDKGIGSVLRVPFTRTTDPPDSSTIASSAEPGHFSSGNVLLRLDRRNCGHVDDVVDAGAPLQNVHGFGQPHQDGANHLRSA